MYPPSPKFKDFISLNVDDCKKKSCFLTLRVMRSHIKNANFESPFFLQEGAMVWVTKIKTWHIKRRASHAF